MQSGGRNALGGKPRIERRLSHLFSFFVVVFSGKSSRKGRRKGAKNGRTNYLLIKLVRAPETTDTIHSQSHREPPNNCLLSRRPPLPISLSLRLLLHVVCLQKRGTFHRPVPTYSASGLYNYTCSRSDTFHCDGGERRCLGVYPASSVGLRSRCVCLLVIVDIS